MRLKTKLEWMAREYTAVPRYGFHFREDPPAFHFGRILPSNSIIPFLSKRSSGKSLTRISPTATPGLCWPITPMMEMSKLVGPGLPKCSFMVTAMFLFKRVPGNALRSFFTTWSKCQWKFSDTSCDCCKRTISSPVSALSSLDRPYGHSPFFCCTGLGPHSPQP